MTNILPTSNASTHIMSRSKVESNSVVLYSFEELHVLALHD
jgi:hypothetical protein